MVEFVIKMIALLGILTSFAIGCYSVKHKEIITLNGAIELAVWFGCGLFVLFFS